MKSFVKGFVDSGRFYLDQTCMNLEEGRRDRESN